MRFLDWDFAPDFLAAVHRESGREIRFTRAERALLQAFALHKGRIWSRDRLLDLVSGVDSQASDRSIDFLINRLRRKLGDAAHKPRYVQTRYGEGYVWLASPSSPEAPSAGAFIVIGPVHGLHDDSAFARYGRGILQDLKRELERRTGQGQHVVLDPDCASPERFQGRLPQFGVTAHFLQTTEARLECVLALRHFTVGSILGVCRLCVHDARASPTPAAELAARSASDLLDALWNTLNFIDAKAPDDPPLPVRMHTAAVNFVGEEETWQEAERRLREALREKPNDHESQLRLATAIHSKYVLSGHVLLRTSDPRRQDEVEIESLVTGALPYVNGNDVLVLTAAKLLYFANHAWRPLAIEIAEETFGKTTSLTAACAIVAQLRAWSGRIGEAVRLYDQILESTAGATHFDDYLRFLKCDALVAAGEVRAAAAVAAPMYATNPRIRPLLCLLFDMAGEVNLGMDLERALGRLDARAAGALLLSHHYISSRLFQNPVHRQNSIHWPLMLFKRRFGAGCIPAEVLPDAREDGIPQRTRGTVPPPP